MQRIFVSFPCTLPVKAAGVSYNRPPLLTLITFFDCYSYFIYFAAAASVAHPSTNAVTTLSQFASV